MSNILRCFSLVVVACVLATMSSTPDAQGTISVTFPSRVAAGPDYATEVLGDAWDMCNPNDISPDPDQIMGFSSFSFLTGPCRAAATTNSADANFMLLTPGLYGILNPGRNGRNFPIDSNKYQVLSYKVSLSTVEDPQVYWVHNPTAHPSGSGLGGRIFPRTSPGTQILAADLTQSLIQGLLPWTSGVVRGIRIDPNAHNAVQNVGYYWFRLTPGNSSPFAVRQNISWTGSGNARISVRDNTDGTTYTIATSVQGSSYSWNYSFLPPGSYTLTVNNASGSGSRAFSINNPPAIDLTNPSFTSGEDYATQVLGNPWDMSNSGDIQINGHEHITNLSFSGGLLHATNSNNDPNITVLSTPNNSVPIDTSKYRYLTYRLQVDGPYDLGAGSVARIFWSSQTAMTGFTTSKDVIVWPGMNTYTMDLALLSTAPDGGLEPIAGAEAWTAGHKRHLRLDPHEFPNARTFHFDEVKLTAKPVAGSTFNIRFVASDADGDSATVSLYYDTDTDPNNGRTLIASGIPQSAGQFNWNPNGVPLGEYFICAESSDGIQATVRYSTVPVQVAPPPTTPTGLRIIG